MSIISNNSKSDYSRTNKEELESKASTTFDPKTLVDLPTIYSMIHDKETESMFQKYVYENLSMKKEDAINFVKEINNITKDISKLGSKFIYTPKNEMETITFDSEKELPESIKFSCNSILSKEFTDKLFYPSNPYLIIRCMLMQLDDPERMKKIGSQISKYLGKNCTEIDEFEETTIDSHCTEFAYAFNDILRLHK